MQFTKSLCTNRQLSNNALVLSNINKINNNNKTKTNNLIEHSKNSIFLTKFNQKIKKSLLKKFKLNYYLTNILKPFVQTVSVYRKIHTTNLIKIKKNEYTSSKKHVPFKIPGLLDASKLETVPSVRQMLVKHAQDTYNGIGLIFNCLKTLNVTNFLIFFRKTDFDVNDKRTVSEGSDTAVIPLSTNKLLQLYYMTHKKTVRYGMLIEQLDMFASKKYIN